MRCLTVKLIGDQTRQRCDRRSKAAQIHAQQQCLGISRKTGQHDRRRHLADALGKCRGDPQFPAQHDVSEKFPHRLNAGNVSHKHKEAHERPQQAVVHLCKQFPVAQQTHRYGGDQTNPVRQHAKYRQQAKHEQQQIPCRRLSRNLFRGSVGFAGTGCFGQKSRQFPQQGVTHGSGWQHGAEKVRRVQLIRRIEV